MGPFLRGMRNDSMHSVVKGRLLNSPRLAPVKFLPVRLTFLFVARMVMKTIYNAKAEKLSLQFAEKIGI